MGFHVKFKDANMSNVKTSETYQVLVQILTGYPTSVSSTSLLHNKTSWACGKYGAEHLH